MPQPHTDLGRDDSRREEFRRALEAVKLRAPIEDVVRERVPALKKRGVLWEACCPFHEERTPSFKVDPRRGTWRCFGACGTGGDQLEFLMRFDNVGFMDAVEILAARTGVEMPRSQQRKGNDESQSRLLDPLEHATRWYRAQLSTSEGQAARRYLLDRGLSDITAEAFGIGYAPAAGTAFVNEARSAGLDLATCEKAGLVRHSDDGRPYDFFRGRLMIPIKDVKGRTVGFGARRLVDDDASGPKYVNTSETELFHKGRLVYALDRALANVRKSAHIVLVEGYTDVMAAHQCGVGNVVAVLGTATTDDHAALIRRTGARKISLVFDGDEAGRKASYKALHGLLPLDAEIDVVSLTGGDDPCDFLVREGGAAFLSQVEMARGWFDFLLDGARGKRGIELSREVDRILELLARIQKPVHRDACIAELAAALELPAAGMHAQYAGLPGQRAVRNADRESKRDEARASANDADSGSTSRPESDREIVAACEELVGAALLDAGLCPSLRALFVHCEDEELRDIQAAMDALYVEESDVTASAVATMLGGRALDGTALNGKGALERLWKILPPPVEAEDPRDVGFEIQDRFKSAHQRLENRLIQREETALTARMEALDEHVLSGAHDASHEQQLAQVRDAFAQIRARKAQLGHQSTVRPQTARK